jgi:hypothetical protein
MINNIVPQNIFGWSDIKKETWKEVVKYESRYVIKEKGGGGGRIRDSWPCKSWVGERKLGVKSTG